MASITEFNEDKWMRVDNAMFGSREFLDAKRADASAMSREMGRIREERSNQTKMRMLYRRAVRDNNIQGALAIRTAMNGDLSPAGIGNGEDIRRRAMLAVRGANATQAKVAREAAANGDPGQLYRDETGAFLKATGEGKDDPFLIDNRKERFAAYGGSQAEWREFGLNKDNRIQHELWNVDYFGSRQEAIAAQEKARLAGVEHIKRDWEDERIKATARWHRENTKDWGDDAVASFSDALSRDFRGDPKNEALRAEAIAEADRLEAGQVSVSEHNRVRDTIDTIGRAGSRERIEALNFNLSKARNGFGSRPGEVTDNEFIQSINANRERITKGEFSPEQKADAADKLRRMLDGPLGERYRSIKAAREAADKGLGAKGVKGKDVTTISEFDEKFYTDITNAANALGISPRDLLAKDDMARVRGWKDLGDPRQVTSWLSGNFDGYQQLRERARAARSDGNVEPPAKHELDWMKRYERVSELFMAQYASSPEVRKLARSGELIGRFQIGRAHV